MLGVDVHVGKGPQICVLKRREQRPTAVAVLEKKTHFPSDSIDLSSASGNLLHSELENHHVS